MALIVQQSMEVDLYQLRRRRIKDDELNSCFSSRQCILFRLLSETHHCMQDITDYVGCTLVFINYVAPGQNQCSVVGCQLGLRSCSQTVSGPVGGAGGRGPANGDLVGSRRRRPGPAT